MKNSRSFVIFGIGVLAWAILLMLTAHIVATGLQYEGNYKIKTLRESQQQQDRIEQKIDLILEK